MNKLRLLVFIILLPVIIQLNLFSLISSRVEGTIVDEESKKPIVNAEVIMFYASNEDTSRLYANMHTDELGYFKLDDVTVGEYFFLIYKEGYAAVGPIVDWDKQQDVFPHGNVRTPPKEYRFYLDEGEIRHFVIKMEEEAILEVNATKKVLFGSSSIFIYSNEIVFKHPSYDDEINSVFTESYRSKYLKEGPIEVTIYSDGYPERIYPVLLEKGTTKTIEHILDFTKGQVCYGIVKDKIDGMPLTGVKVGLQKVDEKSFWIQSITNEYGRYWIGGLKPGTYTLEVYSTYKKFESESIVRFDLNEKKELNFVI